MNGIHLIMLAVVILLIGGAEYGISFNPAHAQSYEKADQNTRFYNFSVAWQGTVYSIPAWITNGNITGIKLYPGGEQLDLQLVPYGDGMVKVNLPRDIFEHGAVGLGDFMDNLSGMSNQTETGFDCNYHTVEAKFSSSIHEITFDDMMSYYTGPGGPILHSLAGTTLESIRPAGWPLDVESEGRICGYSFDTATQKLSLQMRPDLEPDFMQLQLNADMMGKNIAVYAGDLKIPFNQHLEDRQQVVILNFTYPAHASQIYVMANKNASTNNLATYLPLRQSEHGIPPFDVACPLGLVSIIKAEDNSSACVLPEDKPRLVESGWASRTIQSTEIYNSSSPQFGKYFEAGGVMFNVTSTSLDLSNANDTKRGGVKIIVNMTAQSLREKPLYIDDSYFALEGISSDNKTFTVLPGNDNYTKYFIPSDNPSKITYSRSTYVKMAEFEGEWWRYQLNIYLKPRNWHDLPGTVIPLDGISCLAGHSFACIGK